MSESQERNGPDDGSRQEGKATRTSPWEWVLAAVSAALVLGAIGFMLHEAFSTPSTPPEITIEPGAVSRAGEGYVVEFRAHNRGHTTAQSLVVEGELKSGTGTVEKAQVTIDYVPAHAAREAGFFFSHDPREHTLEIRPRGYDRP